LQDVYGIGITRAKFICEKAGVPMQLKVQNLDEQQVRAIQEVCGTIKLEGDLRRAVSMAIKRLRDISCYRGHRHRRNLPLRGQRTRTNARTRKGPRGKQVKR
jgi:small subunit ribosomal protein S13